MADRLPCINPTCRRTGPAEKYPGSSCIICVKCWKALPDHMRKRNKQLWRRTKAIGRNLLRCAPAPNDREHQLRRIRRKCDRLWEALNSAMVTYFTTGETPHGLDDFLKENGLV